MDLLFANDIAGKYPDSWYAATAHELSEFPALRGEVKSDVVIVGAGFTGLSAALHLAQKGFSVAVVDAHRVGWGASGRNGGQVGSGQRIGQQELIKMLGDGPARALWEIAEDSKATLKGLIAEHDIDCAYRDGVAHVCQSPKDVAHELAAAEFLSKTYGYSQIEALDAEACENLLGSSRFKGGVLDWDAGHIHPLNFAIGLAKACTDAGVQIYENTPISHLSDDMLTAYGADGHATGNHLLLACNGYLQGLNGHVNARVMPINNFIVATEPLSDALATRLLSKDVAVADDKFVVNYWRKSHDNRMIYGGGENYSYQFPKDIKGTVLKHMLEMYPDLKGTKIDYAWGGTLGITMNRMPCFVRLAPTVLSASGYSGHGVAMATMAGRILAETVGGDPKDFDTMANVPTHKFPGGGNLRFPLMVLAMTWYSLRDKLGL